MKSKTSANSHLLTFLDSLFMVSNPKELPDADCENCKFRQTPYAEYRNQHCYMFEESPGNKCAQFKQYGVKG